MARPIKRRRVIKKRKSRFFAKWFTALFSLFLILIIVLGMYKFRDGFLYYLGFKTDKYPNEISVDERKLTDIRIYEVLHKHDQNAIGFEYTGPSNIVVSTANGGTLTTSGQVSLPLSNLSQGARTAHVLPGLKPKALMSALCKSSKVLLLSMAISLKISSSASRIALNL